MRRLKYKTLLGATLYSTVSLYLILEKIYIVSVWFCLALIEMNNEEHVFYILQLVDLVIEDSQTFTE